MPVYALDIFADGSARPVADAGVTGAGVYRWLHFDLTDPALPDGCATHLPDLAAQALLQAETRPRCDAYQNGLILNLRGVNLNPEGPVDQMVSLRAWVTRDTVVTGRLRRVFVLDDIHSACQRSEAPNSAATFLEDLAHGLQTRIHDTVLEIEQTIENLEETVHETDEPDTTSIRASRGMVIRLRRYLAPQRDAMWRLAQVDSPVFDDSDDRAQLREASNLASLSNEALEALSARLAALHDFADAHIAHKLARNGYALSIVAAIFLPLSFFTGLFGVNIAGMPGLHWSGAFALLSLSMIAVSVAMLAILKWMRLL